MSPLNLRLSALISGILVVGSFAAACSTPGASGDEQPSEAAATTDEASRGPRLELVDGERPSESQLEDAFTIADGAVVLANTDKQTSVPTTVAAVGRRSSDGELEWRYLRTGRADGSLEGFGEGWVGVALDDATIYGALDHMTGDTGHSVRLVKSPDQGATWREVAVVEKPHYMAHFEELSVSGDTIELGIRLQDCAGCGVPLGAYRYVSRDGGETWSEPKMVDEAAEVGQSVLPAGLYGQWPYESSLCYDCGQPSFAVVWTIRQATEQVREDIEAVTERDLDLQPGYPLVVHTDELGVSEKVEPGIAVVLGLFEQERAADQWRRSRGLRAEAAEIVGLPDLEAMRDYRREHDIERVARVHRDAPSWSISEIERVDSDGRAWAFLPGKEPPVESSDCTVPEGRIVLTPAEIDEWGYPWVETECDGEPVLIRASDTLLRTTVRFDERSQRWKVEQVLGAECDQPIVGRRSWTESGGLQIAAGGC